MKKKHRRRAIPMHIRLAVIHRDKFTCQYCGKVGVFIYRYGNPTVVEIKKGKTIETQSAPNGYPYYNGKDVIAFEFDHIKPVVKGGKNKINNIVLSCRFCNRSKGAKHGLV